MLHDSDLGFPNSSTMSQCKSDVLSCSAVSNHAYTVWQLVDQHRYTQVQTLLNMLPQFILQIKLNLMGNDPAFACALQVVHSFDIDAAAMLYNNEDIWATDRALHALHHRFLLVDPCCHTSSYTYRLIKYCMRYGLALVDPAMDARLIAYSDSFMPAMKAAAKSDGKSDISEWRGLAQLLLLYSNQRHKVGEKDPLGLDGTPNDSYYDDRDKGSPCEHGSVQPLQLCKLWAVSPEARRVWLQEHSVTKVEVLDFADEQSKLCLPVALKRLSGVTSSLGLQRQLIIGKRQPYADWYAHVQQLVQTSNA